MAIASHPKAHWDTSNRRRMGLALAVVLAVAAATAVGVRTWSGGETESVHETPGTQPTPTVSQPAPGAAAPTSAPATTPWRLGYEPLWPFRTRGDADAWRTSGNVAATAPWHASADQTALMFTQVFLGFTELDVVTSHTGTSSDAHVGVGGPTEGGRVSTAAVVHLVRYGPEADAPWEVVGTDDTVLSLTKPAYGATVARTFTAGGRITGVDESIRVQVRQQSSSQPVGDTCCLPAGGDNQPWSVVVQRPAATDGTLTVVAWTGGHIRGVEHFAVTGVRAS